MNFAPKLKSSICKEHSRMKNFVFLIVLLFSFPSLGQYLFKSSPEKSRLQNLADTKHNHLLILSMYKDQIDSEVRRIAEGIEFENSNKNLDRVKKLNEYFLSILLKRMFISEIENQLKQADLDQALIKKDTIFNTEAMKIDLVKEIGHHLDSSIKPQHFPQHVIETFKSSLIDEALKALGKKIYKNLGKGLLKKILISGISNSMLKTVVMSIASEAFFEAGIGTVAHVLTLPLHGYKSTPEQSWLDVIKEHPEMIVNPEWMKYAGIDESPWYVHGYALLRHSDQMEKYFYTFLQNEEKEFKETIRIIYHPVTSEIEKLVAAEPKVDNTRVYVERLIDQDLPFWAIQKIK